MESITGEVLNINKYGSYQEYKAAVDAEVQKSAEGFVRIGYLLKVARDTDILKESGYNSVNEFAEAEYSLDKSQVSRFIRINDEYSEGGYSDKLQDRYKNFGYAKLALMLLLPSAVNEELTADYTKSEIQAVKDEIDEEKKRTDIEVMLEEKDRRQQEHSHTLFAKVLYQIGHDEPELYACLHDAVWAEDAGSDRVLAAVVDALAPAGEVIRSVRIPGEGRKLFSIKGCNEDPVIVDIRSNEKTQGTWKSVIEDILSMCMAEKPEESWESLYGEVFPKKKAEVAPVQPERKEKQTPGKPQRVIRSKLEEMKKEEHKADEQIMEQVKAETAQEKNDIKPDNADEPPAAVGDHTDRIPSDKDTDEAEPGNTASGTSDRDRGGEASAGDDADAGKEPDTAGQENAYRQLSIENYPQYMPEAAENTPQYAIKGYMDALRDNLDKVYILTDRGEYERAGEYVKAVEGTIQKIKEVRS